MEELTTNVNWLAVIVGAVVAFFLGWIWYSPKVLGRKWAEGVGIDLDTECDTMPVAAMVTQAIATLLLAWIVGVTAAHNALFTMILITLTIIFLMIGGGLFSKKSSYAIFTEAGFVVVMVVVMIICQALL